MNHTSHTSESANMGRNRCRASRLFVVQISLGGNSRVCSLAVEHTSARNIYWYTLHSAYTGTHVHVKSMRADLTVMEKESTTYTRIATHIQTQHTNCARKSHSHDRRMHMFRHKNVHTHTAYMHICATECGIMHVSVAPATIHTHTHTQAHTLQHNT